MVLFDCFSWVHKHRKDSVHRLSKTWIWIIAAAIQLWNESRKVWLHLLLRFLVPFRTDQKWKTRKRKNTLFLSLLLVLLLVYLLSITRRVMQQQTQHPSSNSKRNDAQQDSWIDTLSLADQLLSQPNITLDTSIDHLKFPSLLQELSQEHFARKKKKKKKADWISFSIFHEKIKCSSLPFRKHFAVICFLHSSLSYLKSAKE